MDERRWIVLTGKWWVGRRRRQYVTRLLRPFSRACGGGVLIVARDKLLLVSSAVIDIIKKICERGTVQAAASKF